MEYKNIKNELELREFIVESVKAEMLGPGSEDIIGDIENEIITDSPVERYSLGVLFPQQNVEEDPDKNTKENRDFHSFGEMQEHVAMANQMLPAAMGFTIFTKGEVKNLNLNIEYAKYKTTLYKDCKVVLTCDYPLDNEDLNEYFIKEDNLLKLKKNVSGKDVHGITEKYPKLKENNYLTSLLYKLASQCSNEKNRTFGYVRVPSKYTKNILINKEYVEEALNEEEKSLKVSVLKKDYKDGISSFTIMLINNNRGNKRYDKCFFQPKISINTTENEDIKFIDNAELIRFNFEELSQEEKSLELLYLNKKNYSIGHGVATGQNVDDNGLGEVWTDYFPQFDVPQINFDIEEIKEDSDNILSMVGLSNLLKVKKEDKLGYLNKFIGAYSKWIDKLEVSLSKLNEKFYNTASDHIEKCRKVAKRMSDGVNVLENNPKAYEAFELMNTAMTMQRAHSGAKERFPDDEKIAFPRYDYEKVNAKWRPFQLAFILLNLESIVNENSEFRDEVDLLWVPTGGGKTEAYLGLTAFTIFYRRLNNREISGGTTIIMRYTLRLLASQQFIRASILICACELIRQKDYKNLGTEEITIGLWVGSTTTPNTYDEAKKTYKSLIKHCSSASELNNAKLTNNKFQVLKCPWCGTKLEKEWVDKKARGEWGYEFDVDKRIFCPEEECDFKYKLPIEVVDEGIYKNPPTLLFGTVDKFAAITWNKAVSNIFALNKGNENKQPELIIQDELHLISGPLGSLTGLYETAIDAMCSSKGINPKVVASTATIRRADEQCKMLFNRKVNQFPPSGLCIEDSFFTREKSLKEGFGRRYIGIMPTGKTSITAQVRLISILLQGIKSIDASDEIRDKYWTLVGYFNSIRELGKCTTLVEDDIDNNIERLKRRLLIDKKRYVGRPKELTSRLEATQIIQTLKDLEVNYSEENLYKAVNILLASNMISVGVDVNRLNVMMVLGQPKLTSEYIQATSRVGRRDPGLVFTLYNSSKARDISHYERFYSYHQSFYKFVEPTSVTPFSDQVRERALHAVFISMVRHVLHLNDEKMASNFDKDMEGLDKIINFILDRSKETDYTVSKDQREETEKDLNSIINTWKTKIDSLADGEDLNYRSNKKNSKYLIKTFTENDESNAFPTMQSMRNVDNQTGVNLITFKEEK